VLACGFGPSEGAVQSSSNEMVGIGNGQVLIISEYMIVPRL
jgi:hypothetical protein